MRGAAQAVALLLVCALAAAEESDGTVAASVVIAGFPTSHDVMEHAKIDRDVVSIECQVAKHTDAGYAAAKKIYEEGGADACSDSVPSQPGSKLGSGGMRTLASFWPGAHENTAGLAHTVATEPFNKMFDEFEALNNLVGPRGYNPHSEVVFALKGEKEYDTNGDDTQITSSAEFRDQVIKKGIKYQVMMIYALHELEIAVAAYKELGASSDKPKLYTDVWWAFYAGSRETGSATGGGFSPYKLAEKRAKFFGTDTASINNGGKSKVNDILIKATYEIKRLFSLTEDSTAAIDNVMKCVRAQLKVPLIQGCIQYGYKTDTSTNFDDGSATDGYHSEKARKGEIWSFCAGALPFLHEADAPSAVTLFEQVKVDGLSARMPAWTTVKSVFTAANLNKMGVKCADVGGFVDKSADKTSATTLGSDFPQCTDGTLSSAHADSGQCAGDWMSRVVVPDTYDGVAADAAALDAEPCEPVETVVEVQVPWYTYRLSRLEATWGSLEFAHCELNFTMGELRSRFKESRPPIFKTGGLGPLMQTGLYEVWVCIEDHYCSNHPTDKYFCWVLDETKAANGEVAPDQYVPWNHNANLQIVETSNALDANLRTEGQENPRTVETQSFQMRNVRVPAADMTEPSTKTPKGRLREIKNFFEEGLIDEIEYKREKKAVLNENRKRR